MPSKLRDELNKFAATTGHKTVEQILAKYGLGERPPSPDLRLYWMRD